jgi:hypothetical protein
LQVVGSQVTEHTHTELKKKIKETNTFEQLNKSMAMH